MAVIQKYDFTSTLSVKQAPLLTLCPSRWSISISNPFKASTKATVTFVKRSSPLRWNLSCLLKQRSTLKQCQTLALARSPRQVWKVSGECKSRSLARLASAIFVTKKLCKNKKKMILQYILARKFLNINLQFLLYKVLYSERQVTYYIWLNNMASL